MKILVLTISSSLFANRSIDRSGPTLVNLIRNSKKILSKTIEYDVLFDDKFFITSTLKNKSIYFDVILTTGGTGLGEFDVTPEATKEVLTRECPGIVTALLMRSLQATPMAALSRIVAGTIDRCLVVNLPGNPKAVEECFEVLEDILPHAVEILNDLPIVSTSLHNNRI